MERKAFCKPSNDFDVMEPLSDSEGDTEILAPRCQKVLAAAARRRQGMGSFTNSFSIREKPQPAPAKPPRNPDRQLWADITTDDEDNFPTWRPTPKLTAKAVDTKVESSGNARGYDKWSWSTAATNVDLEEELPEDVSPTAASQTTSGERASFSSTCSDVAEDLQPLPPNPEPQVASQGMGAQLQVINMQPQVQPQVQPHMQPQVQPQVQPHMQPQVQPQVQQGMMVAVPAMPYVPFGMGMLPFAMAAVPHFPGQALTTNAPPMLRTVPREEKDPKEDGFENLRRPVQLSGALMAGPPFGKSHRFHQKNNSMGVLDNDARTFTKTQNKGRLSIVCENKVHFQGTVRYAVQFTDGELCSADGVGFILSSDLPCTKNIQKIVSVFANRTGRICIRVHDEVERCPQRVKCLEIGDWLEVNADLTQQTVSFTVWPQDNSEPSYATVSFKDILNKARARGVNGLPRNPCGYLSAVIKHVGVSVTFGS